MAAGLFFTCLEWNPTASISVRPTATGQINKETRRQPEAAAAAAVECIRRRRVRLACVSVPSFRTCAGIKHGASRHAVKVPGDELCSCVQPEPLLRVACSRGSKMLFHKVLGGVVGPTTLLSLK
eukprot:SAG31_NODE_5562_length_2457_cov_1.602205_3_plen_124_part_00